MNFDKEEIEKNRGFISKWQSRRKSNSPIGNKGLKLPLLLLILVLLLLCMYMLDVKSK